MSDTILFLFLMFAGTFLGGYNDIQKKKYLTRGIDDQVLLSISLILGALLLAPVLWFVGIPHIAPLFWPAIIGAVTFGLISSNLFIRAFKVSDASIIASLPLLTPPLVIVTGYLYLGEVPSITGIIGIFVTVAGLWLLLFSDNPFSFSGIKTLKHQKGVLFGIMGAILYAVGFPLDKQAVISSSGLLTTFAIFAGVGTGTLMLNLLQRKGFIGELKNAISKNEAAFVVYSIVLDSSSVLMREALNHSLVAYASSAKRLQALWTVLLSGKLLQEKNTFRRFVAALLMFSGVAITIVWR